MKPNLDTNLFFIAESLYRTLNVSQTAKELHMSQSAVSHALARLRAHFDDALFVRVSKGMAATETAKKLRPSVEEFVKQARDLSQKLERFDPVKAKGRITIATTDLVEVMIMPALLKRLKKEAPLLQISIRPTGGELPVKDLERGTYDFAIAGFYKDLPEGFYQKKLWEGGFSTAFRKGHGFIRGELSPSQFYQCDHALITLQGDFKDGLKRKVGTKIQERNIVLGSYSFTGLAWTLANTDIVLTAPTVLLEKYKEYFPIHIQKPPVEIPKITLQMIWHGITHKDPLKQWFRDVLTSELQKLK